MAYITKFCIRNFKGIEELDLNITDRSSSPVITLVGLNESGKTTILEALSHFVTGVGTISEEKQTHSALTVLPLVPIAKKANFTDSIIVSAVVHLEDSDQATIKEIFQDSGHVLDIQSFDTQFEIKRRYVFRDGEFKRLSNTWDLSFRSRKKRAKTFRTYRRPNEAEQANGIVDLWLASANAIEATLPLIAYFPTFLVDIPDRIYLTKRDDEHPSQRYYREVLQDVLDSLGENLDLDKHVVQRIASHKGEKATTNWLSNFFARPEKGLVDSVIQKISSAISKEVIGSWKNIFNRPISAKLITVDWHVDSEKDDIPYVTFGISDGASKYALHERSLGFRWFFLFLLFTRFKRDRQRPSLFLFDEPAANLHARAQTELLKSFNKIIENKNRIIYSTHSPHMINPLWVPAAHIVENKAINYDSDEAMLNFASPSTSISAIPYRTFVSHYPERTIDYCINNVLFQS